MFDVRKILCLTLLANAAAVFAGTPAPPPVQNPRVPTGAFRMHAPGFDVTPARLVTGFITERFRPEDPKSVLITDFWRAQFRFPSGQ